MIPPGVLKDLQDGRLSQRCPEPSCSVVEAAGFYSTCHNIQTGPADWYRQTVSDVQRARLAKVRAIRTGGGRSQRRLEQEKTAPPAILARPPTTSTAA